MNERYELNKNLADSFTTYTCIPEISGKDVPLVFIRAPWIEKASDKVVS